ncbi:glycosyltransferase family 2 protein [Roseomonas rosulenta]|uniref:glycosyltransferase family 2 protein n=1 Tax=Roseomonas rosulenta TaxID=2748667 RepID=UPI0018E04EB4|nr:glycosyltransferase family 2 protein [Roseomonas rosulenta]
MTPPDADRLPPPRVSVVIPAFNAASLLPQAIGSVAAQTLRDVEVIVVDDASTDDTADAARTLLGQAGLRGQVVRLQSNGGPALARNVGVARAGGEYVAFLDTDDVWMPEKLALQSALLDAHPEVTLCGCQADWVDASGRVVSPLFEDLPEIVPEGWKLLLWNCFVATPCALVRRTDLGMHPFDPALRVGEDRDLWIRLASNGAVGLVRRSMARILISPGSFMATHTELVLRCTVPMVERHLARHADALSPFDRLRARASLHSQIGKGLSTAPGQFLASSRHLLLAALSGFRPLDNLRHFAFTAPGVRDIKRHLKERLGR